LVTINGKDWTVQVNGNIYRIEKQDFTAQIEDVTLQFDAVYILIHGTPGEDGKLQGYFELLSIPYTGCGILASALTFNKYSCKTYLEKFSIPMAKGLLLRKGEPVNSSEVIAQVGLPCFIKPNNGGSSFGVSKIKSEAELLPALEKGFAHDSEIIVESYLQGTEITCGLLRREGSMCVLPITEVVPETEFFDYDAKYLGRSREITPARIDPKLWERCEQLSCAIYHALNCRGVVRIDYMICNNELYFMEVNTIPGMTRQSFVPQQIAAMGWNTRDFLTTILEETLFTSR
ncbi:MAG: D-alanine--D-alanine ligase, partial [Bacteroidales bacterium]